MLTWVATITSTRPPEPENLHALSIRTPTKRSRESRGARTIASSSPNFRKVRRSCDVSATIWNLCVHAKAMTSRSAVSSICCVRSSSKRASHNRSSTIRCNRRPSPPMRSSADRYDDASLSLLSAIDTSASMTLSGVRNSCEASAVNSLWRRCARAMGVRARMPTMNKAP